ncbi:MAG: hypothetical protein AAGB34_03010 [Planctomycetota bacterium]
MTDKEVTMQGHTRVNAKHLCLWIALAGMVAGCSSNAGQGGSGAVQGGVELITEREAAVPDRVRAIRGAWESVQRGEAQYEGVRESLKDLIFRLGEPDPVRVEALLMLVEDRDRLGNTQRVLERTLPLESSYQNWLMIDTVGEVAAIEGWTNLAPAMVTSWSRTVSAIEDKDRSEKKAIEKMFPGRDAIEVVFDVFAGWFDEQVVEEGQREAAWSLLRRLDREGNRIRTMMSELPAGEVDRDELMRLLVEASAEWGTLPRSVEQLRWLRDLQSDEHAVFWRESQGVVQNLDPAQKEGLELRHLAALRWASKYRPDLLTANRARLEESIERRLNGKRKVFRTRGVTGRERAESLKDWRRELVWADLVHIVVAIELADDQSYTTALFAQAERDRKDTSTELGGVIEFLESENRFVWLLYPPRPAHRLGDDRFVDSV